MKTKNRFKDKKMNQKKLITRRLVGTLLIGDNIKITVEKISKGQIKIGIDAPKDMVICRDGVVKKENV